MGRKACPATRHCSRTIFAVLFSVSYNNISTDEFVENPDSPRYRKRGRCVVCSLQGGLQILTLGRAAIPASWCAATRHGEMTRALVRGWCRELKSCGRGAMGPMSAGDHAGSPRCRTPMVMSGGMEARRSRIHALQSTTRRLESAVAIKASLRRRSRERVRQSVPLGHRCALRPWRGNELIGSSDLRVGASRELVVLAELAICQARSANLCCSGQGGRGGARSSKSHSCAPQSTRPQATRRTLVPLLR